MQSLVTSLANSLQEELKAARLLVDVLKQEQAQLIEANIGELTALGEEKAKIIANMSTLTLGRHKALEAAGFPAREEGMQEWLKRTEAANVVQPWNALLALARTGKELNRINGLLIARHMARNQTALNVLQGSGHGGTLYGPDGQATSKSGRRSVVVG